MDLDAQQIAKETLELTRENNHMLKKIRGSQKTAQMLRALYWVIIVALSFGAYVYLTPYLQKLEGIYTQGTGVLDSLKNSTSFLDQLNSASTKK